MDCWVPVDAGRQHFLAALWVDGDSTRGISGCWVANQVLRTVEYLAPG